MSKFKIPVRSVLYQRYCYQEFPLVDTNKPIILKLVLSNSEIVATITRFLLNPGYYNYRKTLMLEQ